MKRLLKIVMVFTIIICIQILITNNLVYGWSREDIINTEEWDPSEANNDAVWDRRVTEIGGNIVAIIRNIGVVVSVIALMIIGLRAMMGSVEEKAEYKKSLPGYLLGVFMVFAITVIPSIIYNVVQNW